MVEFLGTGDTIRVAGEEDLDGIYRLVHETIKESYTPYYTEGEIAYFDVYHSRDRIFEDISEGHVIVGIRDDQVIATGSLRGSNIRRVFVKPGLQGDGLGKSVMKGLENEAAKIGLDFVDLHSSLPAKKFYDSLEYKTLDHLSSQQAKWLEPAYFRMAKMLKSVDSKPVISLKGRRFRVSGFDRPGMDVYENILFGFSQADEMFIGKYKGKYLSKGEIIGYTDGDEVTFKSIHLKPDDQTEQGESKGEIYINPDKKLKLSCSWKLGDHKEVIECLMSEI